MALKKYALWLLYFAFVAIAIATRCLARRVPTVKVNKSFGLF